MQKNIKKIVYDPMIEKIEMLVFTFYFDYENRITQ